MMALGVRIRTDAMADSTTKRSDTVAPLRDVSRAYGHIFDTDCQTKTARDGKQLAPE